MLPCIIVLHVNIIMLHVEINKHYYVLCWNILYLGWRGQKCVTTLLYRIENIRWHGVDWWFIKIITIGYVICRLCFLDPVSRIGANDMVLSPKWTWHIWIRGVCCNMVQSNIVGDSWYVVLDSEQMGLRFSSTVDDRVPSFLPSTHNTVATYDSGRGSWSINVGPSSDSVESWCQN